MLPASINKSNLPHRPGVYIFKDVTDRVIYVGKAIDLYHRVSSYFTKQNQNTKTKILAAQIYSADTIIVESEIEALILEANLIKKYLPQYNIRLTDDKDYLYIKVTDSDFPKIVTARKQDLKDALKSFGPFPSSTTVKTTLQRLRKIFPWCQTAGGRLVVGGRKNSNNHEPLATSYKPCFYYHLGLCPGPCAGVMDKKEYRKIINRFIKFMEGRKQELEEELIFEMGKSAANLDFEEAQITKKMIAGIKYITSPNRVSNYLENPNFLESEHQLGLIELQKIFGLLNLPLRIECYDISNISGKDATGSLVVLTNGEIDKSQYRRFKIQISGKPNDYAMHQEMMCRRLKHKEWGIPQLLLIDGGRGQVRAVKNEIAASSIHRNDVITSPVSEYGVNSAKQSRNSLDFSEIPIYGLAKRMEWLYPPDGDIIKLPKRSIALRLLQQIRDESHRFAITYHRRLRKKSAGFSSRV